MSEILVIGHRNPDTDSICAAIGYAEYKRRTGIEEALAARCGETNHRIDFVLERFGFEAPRFVADVSPRVRDVMQSQLVTVPPETPVAEALALMDENNIRALPVLDDARHCLGFVSVFKISEFYLPVSHRLLASRRVWASLNGIARTLGARVLHGLDADREEDLTLMIGAMSAESFRQRLLKYPPEHLLVVVGDRRDVQDMAVAQGIRCLIVTGGLQVDRAVIEAARLRKVSLLLSSHDSATTAMLCRAAITVSRMVDGDFLAFGEDELLRTAQRRAIDSAFHAFPVWNEAREVVGILSKSDFLKRPKRRLILVDHNELSQAVPGADQVEILEILDHHRLGAFSTAQPILFHNDPVGSTSTIVAECFLREGIEMSAAMAGLLLAGVVSDTLNLTSPTTTARDATVLKRLAALSGVNPTEFTDQLFRSGSILIERPALEAITVDCKEYEENGRRFTVAQIEEVGFDNFWKRHEEVLTALTDYRVRHRLDFSALLVTDVAQQDSLLVIAGERELLELIDYPEIGAGIYELDNIVSRKKQLLPFLTHCLQRMR